MRPKSTWNGAHVRLKRIYDARVPPDMKQRDFGKRYGIGSQSMVAQYLNGTTPLNYDVAAKFATALGCTIYDICPEMGDAIKDRIIPVLGKAMRRAAVIMAALIFQLFQPSDANAQALSHNVYFGHGFFAKSMTLIHIASSWLSAVLRRLVLRHIGPKFRMT